MNFDPVPPPVDSPKGRFTDGTPDLVKGQRIEDSRPLFLSRGSNGEDRTIRPPDHFFGGASQKKVGQPGKPVGTHDDQVQLFLVNKVQEFTGRMAGEDPDLDVAVIAHSLDITAFHLFYGPLTHLFDELVIGLFGNEFLHGR
jgi:hypothetical protein